MSSPPPLPPRTLEISLRDLEPDAIEAIEAPPKVSPARAMLTRVIFAAVFASCLGIMALASMRVMARQGRADDATEPAAQPPATTVQAAAPSTPPLPPDPPAPAAAPTSVASAAPVAPATRAAPMPKKQVQASPPRKPGRTVRASH